MKPVTTAAGPSHLATVTEIARRAGIAPATAARQIAQRQIAPAGFLAAGRNYWPLYSLPNVADVLAANNRSPSRR